VIKSLQLLRGTEPPTIPTDVRKNVELQILPDPPGHPRRPNNDDEILGRAEYISAFVGNDRIRVVAGDYGMRLQATARDLHCLQLRDELRLP